VVAKYDFLFREIRNNEESDFSFGNFEKFREIKIIIS
jgi:hypothetical protein